MALDEGAEFCAEVEVGIGAVAEWGGGSIRKAKGGGVGEWRTLSGKWRQRFDVESTIIKWTGPHCLLVESITDGKPTPRYSEILQQNANISSQLHGSICISLIGS